MNDNWDLVFDLEDGLGWRSWTCGYTSDAAALEEMPQVREYVKVAAAPGSFPRIAIIHHTREVEFESTVEVSGE